MVDQLPELRKGLDPIAYEAQNLLAAVQTGDAVVDCGTYNRLHSCLLIAQVCALDRWYFGSPAGVYGQLAKALTEAHAPHCPAGEIITADDPIVAALTELDTIYIEVSSVLDKLLAM